MGAVVGERRNVVVWRVKDQTAEVARVLDAVKIGQVPGGLGKVVVGDWYG